jgi:hypothetical protein
MKHVILISCSLFALLVNAQTGINYEFFFAFEDAIGNTDTIWYIRDIENGTDWIDYDLGEIPTTSGFVNDLDAQIYVDKFGFPTAYVKRHVFSTYFSQEIYVKATHFPVKITWDKYYVQSIPELRSLSLAQTSFMFVMESPIEEEYVNDSIWRCLYHNNEMWMVELNDFNTGGGGMFENLAYTQAIPPYSGDTARILYFFRQGINPYFPNEYKVCENNYWVSQQDELLTKMVLMPNPTDADIQVSWSKESTLPIHLAVTNSLGQVLFETSDATFISRGLIDVSQLPPGSYFLKAYWVEGDHTFTPFVRI